MSWQEKLYNKKKACARKESYWPGQRELDIVKATMTPIKTRFAPSPTGFLHIGGLRTALYAYLFARKNKGRFILRIEDTDQARFVEGATENLIRTLTWAGLQYDEGPDKNDPYNTALSIGENPPYIQSGRTAQYKEAALELLKKHHAYRCFCTTERLDQMRKNQQTRKQAPMYDKHCQKRPQDEITQLLEQNIPYVIRLAIPENDTLRFRDLIRGDLSFDSNTIDDQILMKSDNFPTYHLANVVDDHAMGITHVIRGEEWLPSTPKHLYLYQAFDWKPPEFAHIPLLLNKDKSKLSKRQNDVAVEDYIQRGYLKEAILNFIALLGWNPGEGETEEFFSLEELVERFSLEKVHKAGAVFDLERLDWFNAHYIKKLKTEELAEKIYPYLEKSPWFNGTPDTMQTAFGYRCVKSIQTRIKTLAEAPAQLKPFLLEELDFDLALLENEKMKVTREIAKQALTASLKDLSEEEDKIFDSEEKIKEILIKTIARLGLKNGQVLWPLRVALSGSEFSPGAFEMAHILGKTLTLDRIQKTLARFK